MNSSDREAVSGPVPAHFASRRHGGQRSSRGETENCCAVLALPRRIYWSDEIQLSFQITIYSLVEKPRHSCIRECARVGFYLVIPGPGLSEEVSRSSGPLTFRLQGGLPSLDTTRSRTDTYTRPSACNHPSRSPSFPRMTFRLSCCASPGPGARRTPPVGPDGRAKICPFRPLVRLVRRLYPARIIIYNHSLNILHVCISSYAAIYERLYLES